MPHPKLSVYNIEWLAQLTGTSVFAQNKALRVARYLVSLRIYRLYHSCRLRLTRSRPDNTWTLGLYLREDDLDAELTLAEVIGTGEKSEDAIATQLRVLAQLVLQQPKQKRLFMV